MKNLAIIVLLFVLMKTAVGMEDNTSISPLFPVKVSYTLTPNLSEESPCLCILVSFEGSQSQETIIEFPDNWANGYQGKALRNIKIEEDGNVLLLTDTKNSAEKKVIHTAGAKLNLSYEVHPTAEHPHDVERAIIHKDFIQALGHALFAIPQLGVEQTYEIRWQQLPENWQTLSSYGFEKEMVLHGNAFLKHALYIAGLSRIYKFDIEGYPVYVSLEGTFKEKDVELLDYLKKIVHSQRSFFGDYHFPFYFFSLISSKALGSAGGTGLENCFTAYFPKELDSKEYLILIAHEHMHAWTGGKIKKNALEGLAYWWSEGFTEYYARLILYRSGLLSRENFVSEINSFFFFKIIS